ncbi:DNA translocase FtsK [bacterium]|nr:DNA translocase FtsK [bacterium]
MARKKGQKKKRGKKGTSRWTAIRVAFGIACATFAVFSVLAITSYHPDDPPKGTADFPHNTLGTAGAEVAHFFVNFTFGKYLSLLFPLWILTFTIEWIRRKGYFFTFKVGSLVFIAAMLASSVWGLIELGSQNAWEDVGLIGHSISTTLDSFLNVTGSWIVLVGVILIYITLVFRNSFSFFGKIIAVVVKFARWIISLLKRIQIKIPSLPERTPKPRVEEAPIIDDEIEGIGDDEIIPEPVEDIPLEELFEPEEDMEEEELTRVEDDIPTELDETDVDDADLQPEEETDQKSPPEYVYPPLDLLIAPQPEDTPTLDEKALREMAAKLEERIGEFGVEAKVVRINPGPVITRFDLKPAKGVKVNKIVNLADDIALSLSANSLRIQAPIPGEGAVGIEVPNEKAATVRLREICESPAFQNSKGRLTIALGKTAQGDMFVTDLAKMPHLLIAGTTGSGKSVCINTIISSLLLRNKPQEVLIAMVDPKKIELSTYAELRKHHLLYLEETDEVIATEPKNAVMLLQSIVNEMEQRYDRLAETGARNILEFNRYVEQGKVKPDDEGNEPVKLPYIVVIIDELADLMLTASKEVEEPIARLAQMARAIGIHLVVATQRPSVNVITGVIKANFPGRLAFMVATKIDSRTILDKPGAQALLGMGDSLLQTNASPHPTRIHGALITTDEVHALIAHVSRQPAFVKNVKLKAPETSDGGGGSGLDFGDEARDALFAEGVRTVVRTQQGSVSLLQRRLKIGYARAGRILDQLEQAGVVGPFEGSKAREVLISAEEVEEFLAKD